jgi:hypothetical protein
MIAPNITCDVCGCLKQETNHWFLAFTRKGAYGITFGRFADRDLVPTKRGLVVEDICGHACAQTRLSRFLNSISA